MGGMFSWMPKSGFVRMFIMIYAGLTAVSFFHAAQFFGLGNAAPAAFTLAFCFEVGQVLSMMAFFTTEKRRWLAAVILLVMTFVQILGNVHSTYAYLSAHSATAAEPFKESVLGVAGIDADTGIVVSYLTGAVLPLLVLGVMVVVRDNTLKNEKPKRKRRAKSAAVTDDTIEGTSEDSDYTDIKFDKYEDDGNDTEYDF